MLVATLSSTDRILLDYDVPYETFKEKYLPTIINRANELLGNLFLDYGITKSASGNTHMVIRLRREVTQFEALIIAVLLGSDFKRECFNWLRLFAFGIVTHCSPSSRRLRIHQRRISVVTVTLGVSQ